MDTDDLSLKLHSLLRRTGLSAVPKPILLGVSTLGVLLVIVCLWQFWPRANADFISPASHSSPSTLPDESCESIEEIVIDIEGAVISPGLYTLSADARIGDAVQAAGGLNNDAAGGTVNLAQKLSDGELVYIPSLAEQSLSTSQGTSGTAGDTNPSQSDGKISINSASANELEQLDGVGPALSKRIIEYRQNKGRFSSLEDLKNVAGIGEKKFESIKDSIRL